ncbi:GNAT family N-acetyltransferase [Pseudonocardia abyssalis]|uniref:GNAT family N-acetyltransferase n=1 Tax=Pseudonocardia abyssalis TaxID=2792008 RepID=UPI001C49D8CD|nr:GNAT family N-acetyltransferase [Pseudonocardia abyssalis]MBW0118360.1 GNAT family N-acetyltransferase [Pseudonocardia abyssalis]
MITWRPVAADDFLLLGRWLAEPAVARWWNHETSPEAVERDFGPTLRGEEPSEDLIASVDGRPFGLAQRCRVDAYPDEHAGFAALTDVPDGAMTIDYLVGEPGRGLGTPMIRSLLADTWRVFPDAPCVIVAVAAGNVASWRALEKAGLVRIAEGHLEPGNPVDDGRHVVYRIDRPQGCERCPAVREGADPTWSRGTDGWLCPACTRRHVRDIESKLASEWW